MALVDSSVLDKRCSLTGVLFAKISEVIVNWEELAPYFGLTEAEVQEIKANCTHSSIRYRSIICCGSGPRSKEIRQPIVS